MSINRESSFDKKPDGIRVELAITGLTPGDAMEWVRRALDATPKDGAVALVSVVDRDVSDRVYTIKTVRDATLCGLKEAIDAVNVANGDAALAVRAIQNVGGA